MCGNLGLLLVHNPKTGKLVVQVVLSEGELAAHDQSPTLPPDEILREMVAATSIRGGQAGGFSSLAHPLKELIEPTPHRVRIIGRKRSDLAEDMRTALLNKVFMGNDKTSTGVTVIGHTRFATGSLNKLPELHPHDWSKSGYAEDAARARNERERVWWWDEAQGQMVEQLTNFTLHLTHNGDFEAFDCYSRVSVVDEIGVWLNKVLPDVPNSTKGDSPKVAGLVQLMRVQGRWGPALRLAWLRVACTSLADAVHGGELRADAPSAVPHADVWNGKWAAFVQPEWTRSMRSIIQPLAGEDAGRYKIDHAAAEAFKARLCQLLAPASAREHLGAGAEHWTPDLIKGFVHHAVRGFLFADLYDAVGEVVHRAHGSLGLQVHCTIERLVVIIASQEQPMSVAFTIGKPLVLYGSEMAAIQVAVDQAGAPLRSRFDLDVAGTLVRLGPRAALAGRRFTAHERGGGGSPDLGGALTATQCDDALHAPHSRGSLDAPNGGTPPSARSLFPVNSGVSAHGAAEPQRSDSDAIEDSLAAGAAGGPMRSTCDSQSDRAASVRAPEHCGGQMTTYVGSGSVGAPSARPFSTTDGATPPSAHAEAGARRLSSRAHGEAPGAPDDDSLDLENGIEMRAYSLTDFREYTSAELATMHVPVPAVTARTEPTADPVKRDLGEIPQTIRAIDADWARRDGRNARSADALAALLLSAMRNRRAHTLQTIDLLIGGIEASLWLAEQFAVDLARICPWLTVRCVSANKLLGVLTATSNRVHFSGEERITPEQVADAAILLVSHSGQTFPALRATEYLERLVGNRIWLVTATDSSQMELALSRAEREERVLITGAGYRPAEPSSLAVAAMHHTFTHLLLHVAEFVHSHTPDDDHLHMPWELEAAAKAKARDARRSSLALRQSIEAEQAAAIAVTPFVATGPNAAATAPAPPLAVEPPHVPTLRPNTTREAATAALSAVPDMLRRSIPPLPRMTPLVPTAVPAESAPPMLLMHAIRLPDAVGKDDALSRPQLGAAMSPHGFSPSAVVDGSRTLSPHARFAGGNASIQASSKPSPRNRSIGQHKREVPASELALIARAHSQAELRNKPLLNLTDHCIDDLHSMLRTSLVPNLEDIVGVHSGAAAAPPGGAHDALVRPPKPARRGVLGAVSRAPRPSARAPVSVHDALRQQGKRWGRHVAESWLMLIATGAYVLLSVTLGAPIVWLLVNAALRAAGQGAFARAMGWSLFEPASGGALAPVLVGFAVRAADATLFVYCGKLFTWALRLADGRPLWARHGHRSVVIVDTRTNHRLLEAFASKLFAQAYSFNGVTVHGAEGVDDFVHLFTHRVARGGLIAMGRPDGRLCSLAKTESALLLAGKQAFYVQNADYPQYLDSGNGPEVVSIGHNPFCPPAFAAHVVLPSFRRKLFVDEIVFERVTLSAGRVAPSLILRAIVGRYGQVMRTSPRMLMFHAAAAAARGTGLRVPSADGRTGAAADGREPEPRPPKVGAIGGGNGGLLTAPPSGGTPARLAPGASQEGRGARRGVVEHAAVYAQHRTRSSRALSSSSAGGGGAADVRKVAPSGVVGRAQAQYKGSPYGSHLIRPETADAAPAAQSLDGLLRQRSLKQRARAMDKIPDDPNVIVGYLAKLDTDVQEVNDRHLTLQHFHESRIASLERYVSFCVMFHAMAEANHKPPLRRAWNVGKSQSNLRVATTAAPVPGSDALGAARDLDAAVAASVRQVGNVIRGFTAHF
ncbi:hypothetical protein KFE25_000594 [Diacronema lutheri]|uniref:Glutamine amidotransferase type-2 domain-containing protein n=5 Tax=Diacronema lutheri TaxID=2081491 RepID=A0A8J5XLW0_DIALT|nr:hypothetical protein KFE25_000594 [Diacronema lutheri]